MGKTTDIREAVEAELSFDPLVDSADISVRYIKMTTPAMDWTPARPVKGGEFR